MRKWEDIIKDKMDGYESTLPEGSLSEFRARRNVAAGFSGKKKFPLIWVMSAAVAAGLAAVIFLRKPDVHEDGIQIIQQPEAPVAFVNDTTEMAFEPIKAKPVIAQAVTHKAAQPVAEPPKENDVIEYPDDYSEPEDKGVIVQEEKEDEKEKEKEKEYVAVPEEPIVTTGNMQVNKPVNKPVKISIAPAAGTIAVGGVVAALLKAVPVENDINASSSSFTQHENSVGDHFGYVNPGGDGNTDPVDVVTGKWEHYMPLKVGLSTRFPISDLLNITTGLEYSHYSSKLEYSGSGGVWQRADYLGIPVRLDWTIASNNWLELYLGGGMEADYCLSATLGGNSIHKDGFAISLLGASGIQFNLTRHLGVYLEPEMSWTVPSDNRWLETYRTDHPLMFSLASGLRINLGK